MNRSIPIVVSLLLLFSSSIQAQSKWANRVLEFLPAPGQFTNEKAYPAYNAGDDAVTMANKATAILNGNAAAGTSNNMSTISLGAYGGYIVAGFDHSVKNKPYSYDLKIHGNWFDGNAEAGIVMVSKDENGNGLADDAWYELAGSEFFNPGTIHQYEIRYERPNPLDGNVRWTDNQGKSGYVLRNSYHLQESYYPLWYDGEKLIFRGTKLQPNAWNSALPPQQYWRSESFAYGYADNQGNASELSNFDLDWAVDVNGNKVNLDRIDFVKVYTGLIQDAGWLGETSTEFSQAEDLHPEYSSPPVFLSDVHIVTKLPALAANTHAAGSALTTFTDDTVTFKGYFENSILTDGYTYTNEATGVYASASGNGVGGNGSSYISGIYNAAVTDNANRQITFNDGLPHGLEGVYVNNTAIGAAFMQSKLIKGDFVKLVATAYDAQGVATGVKSEFRLADYTLANSIMHYIVKQWCWMDLTSLGSASSVVFTLQSNRPGIIPAGFCLDQLVIDIISITKHPVGNPNGTPKICADAPYKLTTEASGTGLSYQWYKNGAAVQGANTSTLDFSAAKKTDSGNYYCIVSNGSNQARSKEVPLVVYANTKKLLDLPRVDTIKVLQTEKITLSTLAEGDNLTYQWYKGDTKNWNNPIYTYPIIAIGLNSTAKSPDLIPAPDGFIATHNGAYFCLVTGSCGSYRTDTVFYFTVPNPNLPEFKIIKQTQDTTICFGNSLYFKIDAPAATAYSWQKKTVSGTFGVLGASTKKDITIANVVENGSYRCVLNQDTKTFISDTIDVTVIQKLAFVKPAAIAHVSTYTAYLSRKVEMEVEAIDFTPISYQWFYKGATDTDYILLTSATSNTYALEYATAADAGKYRCEVMGAAGKSVIEYTLSVTSSIAKAPVIYSYTNTGNSGTIRSSGLFTPGEKAFFNAQVQTTGGFTFKWFKDGQEIVIPAGNTLKTGDDVIAENGYWTKNNAIWYLYIKNVQEIHAGEYVLETTDPNGIKERSAPLRIIVNPKKPEITNILSDITTDEGTTVSFKVIADGKGFTPTYQWYRNGVAVMGGTKSPYITEGPDKTDYAFTAKVNVAGSYYCIITTPGGSDTSNVAILTVNPAVRILKHPSDQIVLSGSQATFTITAEGTGLSYQWQKDGADISGATTGKLTVPAASLSDEGQYACIVSATGLVDAQSGFAGLSVIDKPVISGYALCSGETQTTLRVQPQIKPVQVRYQWFKDGQAIIGATYSWISVSETANNQSSYYCMVSNSGSTETQSTEIILIKGLPKLAAVTAQELTVKETEQVALSLTATGQNLAYSWYKDEKAVDGKNTSAWTFIASKADAGVYYGKVSNACGNVSGHEVTLKVELNPPVITTQPVSQRVAVQTAVVFQLVATGSELTYQWYKDGDAIDGATASEYTVVSATQTEAGKYTCKVSNSAGTITSNEAVLEIDILTSVDDALTGNVVTCYPNPAENYITVKATAGDIVEISDLTGRLIYTHSLSADTTVLPLTGIESGLYILHIKGVNDKTIRFVKK